MIGQYLQKDATSIRQPLNEQFFLTTLVKKCPKEIVQQLDKQQADYGHCYI